jgi:hypothetical protein
VFYRRRLPAGFIAPCLPSNATQPPSGALWLHEIKHDGLRIIARKDGQRVRLYSRPGNDLTPQDAGASGWPDRTRSSAKILRISELHPVTDQSRGNTVEHAPQDEAAARGDQDAGYSEVIPIPLGAVLASERFAKPCSQRILFKAEPPLSPFQASIAPTARCVINPFVSDDLRS